MDVPVFITMVVGIVAILSALVGFGIKIGIEAQKRTHLTKTVADLKSSVRRLHRRLDRLAGPQLDDDDDDDERYA